MTTESKRSRKYRAGPHRSDTIQRTAYGDHSGCDPHRPCSTCCTAGLRLAPSLDRLPDSDRDDEGRDR